MIPLSKHLYVLIIDMAIMGIFMGIIDTVANVSLLKIYGKLVSPFLQVGYKVPETLLNILELL